jgi:hypothetical protein
VFLSGFIWFHHSFSLKKLVEVGENVEDDVQVFVRIQGSRPGIMLTCIVSFMAITPIVSEREGLQ